jgi:hypothetical protein
MMSPPTKRPHWLICDGLRTRATPDRLRPSMAALRPRGRGSVPHRGKNLAAKKLDAGEDLVLAHPRPTHPHREVVNAAAMLGDQHIDDARGRAHREPLRRQRAELLLGAAFGSRVSPSKPHDT